MAPVVSCRSVTAKAWVHARVRQLYWGRFLSKLFSSPLSILFRRGSVYVCFTFRHRTQV
jgi:hypothetical protein